MSDLVAWYQACELHGFLTGVNYNLNSGDLGLGQGANTGSLILPMDLENWIYSV